MNLLYRLLNKPWEWRSVLADYRQHREAQWELVHYWHEMRIHTCKACLREMARPSLMRICSECWLLLSVPQSELTVRESIRRNRVIEVRNFVDAW